MAATIIPCPSCGSEATRPLTREELLEQTGGHKPLLVVMPRTCPACGHVWEPLSRRACYLMAALAAAGFLLGSAFVVGCAWILVQSALAPAGGANNLRNRVAVAGLALAMLAFSTGAAATCRKYLRLARRP